MNRLIPFILFLSLLYSCDTIPEDERLIPVEQIKVERNILLEYYTGMRCPNCPQAAENASQLKELYKENLILVTIHAGIYAQPSGIFVNDFRTSHGDLYNAQYGFNAYPIGLIDRAPYNNKYPIFKEQWGSALQARAKQTSAIEIDIKNRWNESANQVEIEAKIQFLDKTSENLTLQLWIVEDSVIAPQLNGSEVIYDYIHRHMFRDVINNSWGEELFHSNQFPEKGDTIKQNYTYTLKSNWKAKHCSIIGFVYNQSNRSVIQCIERKIIE